PPPPARRARRAGAARARGVVDCTRPDARVRARRRGRAIAARRGPGATRRAAQGGDPTVRMFASQLRRLPVNDPAGERIGRVRDIVVTMLPGGPPRLTELLVSVGRKPIFVGAGTIASITASGILLSSARLSLPRSQQN